MSKKRPSEINTNTPSRRWPRFLAAAALLAAAVFIVKSSFIQTLTIKNGRLIFMRYSFKEEDSGHPRLQLLRHREKLDAVVAPGKTQLEKFILLRKWTHDQWKSHGNFYYPPWDAVEILDLARKHHNCGFCAQYAIVYVQACRALGLHARYVDIGHFLAEVWSDEHDRWVVMDPTNDLHYERDGVPLRGRDLANASWQSQSQGIFQVSADGSRTPITDRDLLVWRDFSIVERNDHLSRPVLIQLQGQLAPLVHQDDYHRYPLAGEEKIGWAGEFLTWLPPGRTATEIGKARTTSDDPADFRNNYNQAIIMVVDKSARKGYIKLRLEAENTPDFQVFLVSADGDPFSESSHGNVMVVLKPGMNTFRAKVKTRSGWVGPESSIRIFYKTDWLSRT